MPSFRLLRLYKGEGRNIFYDLSEAFLHQRESAISYEALSYAWGSSETTDYIIVNGGKLPITANLFWALFHLRLRDEDRILWVDAVCINQNHHREKTHQVQQMGDIYKQADRVIFWLGPAT